MIPVAPIIVLPAIPGTVVSECIAPMSEVIVGMAGKSAAASVVTPAMAMMASMSPTMLTSMPSAMASMSRRCYRHQH